VFQHEYVEALLAAEQVILGGVLRKDSDQVAEEELFSPAQLVADLRRRGGTARCLDSADAIAATIAREAVAGDVVVMMSNGDFGGLRGKLIAALAG
jgi:UDP-N-acetylmuramate: L-alanyl-gamma-D-glutamyl-meso-diaminopimelate ligase